MIFAIFEVGYSVPKGRLSNLKMMLHLQGICEHSKRQLEGLIKHILTHENT